MNSNAQFAILRLKALLPRLSQRERDAVLYAIAIIETYVL